MFTICTLGIGCCLTQTVCWTNFSVRAQSLSFALISAHAAYLLVSHTPLSDGVASFLVAGFVFQVLGCCDLFLQEGAPLFQFLQR